MNKKNEKHFSIVNKGLSYFIPDKKAELGLITVVIVLAIAIVALVVSGNFNRECNRNAECSSNSYCGADYACHEYPDEVQVTKNTFLPAAFVFGGSLIVAAYIFKGGKLPFKKEE